MGLELCRVTRKGTTVDDDDDIYIYIYTLHYLKDPGIMVYASRVLRRLRGLRGVGK